MNQSKQNELSEPFDGRDATDGLIHIENSVGMPQGVDNTEPYQPCDGTWSEFVGDMKKTLSRMRAEVLDRAEDFSERWNGVFHRKSPQPVIHQKIR